MAESKYGLNAVPGTGSTATVRLLRVTVSLGVMQVISGSVEGRSTAEHKFTKEILALGPSMVIENDIEWEQ